MVVGGLFRRWLRGRVWGSCLGVALSNLFFFFFFSRARQLTKENKYFTMHIFS
jgi:hypothetical protein